MFSYVLRRILQMVPTLAGVILLVFFLFKYFGGDPAEILGGLGASAQQVESIRNQLGLNKPVWEQLWLFVQKIVTFDWGRSWATNEAVSRIFATRLPATLTIMIQNLVLEVMPTQEKPKQFYLKTEHITKLQDKKCGFPTLDFVRFSLFLPELKTIKTLQDLS